MKSLTESQLWEFLRLSMSFIMLWAFFDKLLGLGFATSSDKAWIAGVSPTTGFLKFAPDGPLAFIFNSLSGNVVVDLLFMSGLLLTGLSLLLGIGIRVASCAGSLMMFLIYLSLFPPENNPLIDEHIIYILVLYGIAVKSEKQSFGFADKWKQTKLVKRLPILK